MINRSLFRQDVHGLTLLEVIIAMAIIGITSVSVLFVMRNTWSGTRSSNKMMVAGQAIESQIEAIRLGIARDSTKFPPKDSILSSPINGVNVKWKVETDMNPSGANIPNVRKLTVTAKWQSLRAESLQVVTYIAKSF